MAIAIDSVVTQTNFTDTTADTVISVTPPSGGGVVMVVALSIRENDLIARVPVSMIFNGSENLTQAVQSNTNGSQVISYIWYIVNPTSTTADLVIEMGGACQSLYFTVVHITGSDTVSPIDGTNAMHQNDISGTFGSTITTTYDNSILIDCFSIDDDDGHTMDVETGRVERLDAVDTGNSEGGSSTRTTTTAGSHDMAWTRPTTTERTSWAVLGIKEGAVAPVARRIMIVN